MTWIDLLTAFIFAVLLFANHLWGFWRGKKRGAGEEMIRFIGIVRNLQSRTGRWSPSTWQAIRIALNEEQMPDQEPTR